MFDNLPWNPYFGVIFLVAAVATAWAVAAGRFGWWPVAVFFSSVSAQSHLVYAVPAIALAVVAPVVGLLEGNRPPRRRWLLVGLFSWVPTLVQEVTTRPGNLSLIFGSNGLGPPVGIDFGLHALATAAAPRPIWLQAFPFLVSLTDRMPELLRSRSVAWGVLALCLLVVVAVWGRRTGRRQLSALAAIGFVLAAGSVISFAEFPRDNLGPVGYLSTVLWVVGMVIWVVLIWAVAELLVALWGRRRQRDRVRGRTTPAAWALPLAGLVLLCVAAIAGVRSIVPAAAAVMKDGRVDRAMDAAIARSVVRHTRPVPLTLVVRPFNFVSRSTRFGPTLGLYVVDEWGVAILLLQAGRQPRLPGSFAGVATHVTVPPGARWPEVLVHIDPSTLTVTAVRRDKPPARE